MDSPPAVLRTGALHRRYINDSTNDDDLHLHATTHDSSASSEAEADLDTTSTIPLRTIEPNGPKALSGISLRAFLLGIVCAIAALLSLYTALDVKHGGWRSLLFISLLALFHFLEFYMTAAHNTRQADIAAFLLSTNGAAYAVAHASALLECTLASFFFPSFQSTLSNKYTLIVAVLLITAGQTLRSAAMAQAGQNFNHTIQTRRATGHELVTTGVYGWCRHPSYCGFFWWALGTQVLCGNALCFVAYAAVLWRFFSHRIRREEELLCSFFGEEVYRDYCGRTTTGIPFVS